jgi:hypothetical protein
VSAHGDHLARPGADERRAARSNWALRERVWSKLVSKASLASTRQRYSVLSTRLVGGQPLIHVYSDARPDNGFEPVVAGLEDVYFRQLRSHGAAAHA